MFRCFVVVGALAGMLAATDVAAQDGGATTVVVTGSKIKQTPISSPPLIITSSSPAAIGFTLYTDLGIPQFGNRALPNSDQFVKNDGNFGASIAGTFDFPVGPNLLQNSFWWALGWYLTYIHGTPVSVENNNLPGSLAVSGHDDTWAAFVTGGARWRPFSGALTPLEVMALVGFGFVNNNVSLLGTGGNELLSSRLTSFAWMTRFALNYWFNDTFAFGLFVTYLAAQNATARLTGGTSVPYGRPDSVLMGLTLSIAISSP